MKITFNTGRLYTETGQIITAEAREDKILFKDHSRLICGEYEHPQPGNYGTPTEFVDHVMWHYDWHKYQMSTEAINLEQCDTIHKFRI